MFRWAFLHHGKAKKGGAVVPGALNPISTRRWVGMMEITRGGGIERVRATLIISTIHSAQYSIVSNSVIY